MSPVVDFSPPATPATLHQLVAGRRVAPHGWQTHVIRPGETLLGIALQHRTSTGVLVRRNHLPSTRLIKAGTRIDVPRTSPAAKHKAARHHARPKKSGRAAAKAAHATQARHRAKRPARTMRILVVRPGETVSAISLRLHVSMAAILKANKMTDGRQLWAGQRLRVPGTASHPAHRAPAKRHPKASHPKKKHAATKKHAKKTAARRSASTTVTVRPGDTVSGLALHLHVSQTAVLRAAGISDPHRLQAGQTLRLRGAAANRTHPKHPTKKHAATKKHAKKAAARRGASTTVTVRPGDTVSGLALHLHVSQTAVLRAAGISDPHRLQAGQTLRLRGAAANRTHPKASHATKAKRSSPNTFEGRTYANAVVRSAARNRQLLASRSLPTRSQTKALIARTARRHGIDPKLALAVSYQESGWSQRQVSVANAIGAMQVIPSTGQWASQMVGRRLNLLDPQDNVTAGVVVLRALVRSASSEEQAIAGYYQGLAGVRAHGMYPDTRRYVANVLYHKRHL